MSDIVIAQVVLRSSGGTSVLDPDESITSENVDDAHQVRDEDLEEATEKLRALGFEIVQTSEVGLTIAGAKERYEDAFDTTLEAHSGSADVGESYEAKDPIRIPEGLSSLVEDVTFPVPPEFF